MRIRWTQLRDRSATAATSAFSGGAPARAETARQLGDLRARLRPRRVRSDLSHRLRSRWDQILGEQIRTAAALAALWVFAWLSVWGGLALSGVLGSGVASWGELAFTVSGGGVGLLAVFIAYRAYHVATRAYEAARVAPSFQLVVQHYSSAHQNGNPVTFKIAAAQRASRPALERDAFSISVRNVGNAVGQQLTVQIQQGPLIFRDPDVTFGFNHGNEWTELPGIQPPVWAYRWPNGFLAPNLGFAEAGSLVIEAANPPAQRSIQIEVVADRMTTPETFWLDLDIAPRGGSSP